MADITIIDNTGEARDEKDKAVERALTAIGLFLEGEAKLELESDPRRVDTGNLRNSVTNEVDMGEPAVYVGTNVEYGIYVHEGTRHMAANRFLRNAVQNNIDQIQQYLQDALYGN